MDEKTETQMTGVLYNWLISCSEHGRISCMNASHIP